MFPSFVRPLALSLLALALQGLRAEPAPLPCLPPPTHPGAGQTVYFLLTDRFANGSPANDRGGLGGGPDDHGFDPSRISHYHGGDFAGLTTRLDYLRDLGATAVWVTPPFRNKPVQRGTAGYHGYWILDFLQIDPHLGTNAEFREFVRQAHARGLRVYMDIIVNHTADVIRYADGTGYIGTAAAPWRDARGREFDARAVAYDGTGDPDAFPPLSATGSFAKVPLMPPAEAHAKNPAWLNEPTLYHNRGDSTFAGESAVYGDFAGLDDLLTEHPRVVEGFIDVFSQWLLETEIDGFRIDTAKHVNAAFWTAFIPALRARARVLGRPDFLQFGEVYSEAGDPAYLGEFSTGIPIDTTLDFGFAAAARRFVAQQGTAAGLNDFFARDDHYTDHDGNVHATPTFLGNHDMGRFAYFCAIDNPGATPEQLAALVRLGHGLLFLSRGQPVVYYGDEQGMVGRGGDMAAREDLFAAQAPEFRDARLLATTRTGADDKFDTAHPFYALFRQLASLRAAHPALRTGAMLPRPTAEPGIFAFSRLERSERIEYVAAFNNSRTTTLRTLVFTAQPAGARLERVFSSAPGDAPEETAAVTAAGALQVELGPLQFTLWRATAPLPAPADPLRIALVNPASAAVLDFATREIDGLAFESRQEIRAEVTGGDGWAEVTFLLRRRDLKGQFEYLGTDDSPPYRVFWRPPADLGPDEPFEVVAVGHDRRGQRATAAISGITISARRIGPSRRGAAAPRLATPLPANLKAVPGRPLVLQAAAEGTGAPVYQWYKDGEPIEGAAAAELSVPAAEGLYHVAVRNHVGTTVSAPTLVRFQQ